jgi:hypothetical protein
MNHIGSVIVSMLTSSAEDDGLGQTIYCRISIRCFSVEHAALSSKSNDWLSQNQDKYVQMKQHVYLCTFWFSELAL